MKLNVQKIEVLIAKQGITRAQLAARSGCSRQNLSTIVRRGTAEPRTVGKLAAGLGCQIEDLLEGGD